MYVNNLFNGSFIESLYKNKKIKVYLIKILDLIKLIFYTCKLIIIFLRIKDEKSSILSDF